ncbi:LLM class flavin-dependent oxidoreductase [Bacillus sp. B1-b2]|uniref:LLM class flavin-dependent oxidoreductase n=1 Tax=Bacillus sp. B1-b2 TaxID=2653201 RepID=UPI00126200A7|nr:LLM class flavin-dependent oxidoreductase [Bacillus sp. B1-b2]KAB7666286.1 LLM class flavin-dependent oxidoreductase [Bacillus sp. B1-b2]
MRLSVLDQSPISAGQTAKDALDTSLTLAKLAEEFGFTRYWIAEHHDLKGLACSNPEVMLSYIGANTKKISIGSGAVLLPYYKPYKVAETYNMLQTLFPSRVDVGVGRAPGGPAEASNALSDHYLQQVWKIPESIDELLHFLYRDFPVEHPFVSLTASPVPNEPPSVWLLGTSKKSATLAATKGLSYVFGHFMSDALGAEIIQEYRDAFKKSKVSNKPYVIVAVSVICAKTTEEAENIAYYSLLLSLLKSEGVDTTSFLTAKDIDSYSITQKQKEKLKQMRSKMIVGNQNQVKEQLKDISQEMLADELMIITNTFYKDDRMESYKLIGHSCMND